MAPVSEIIRDLGEKMMCPHTSNFPAANDRVSDYMNLFVHTVRIRVVEAIQHAGCVAGAPHGR
jgi:hypothetical protein